MFKSYLHTFSLTALLSTLLAVAVILPSCKQKLVSEEVAGDPIGLGKRDSITLQLEEIKVLFPVVEQWEEKGAIVFRSDSAIIYDRNSEMLLEKSFTINIDVTKDISVEQQYETRLSIITQEGNVRLDDLDRYVSPWIPITQRQGSNKFVKEAYTSEDINRFPETSINAVLEHLFWKTRTTKSEFDWSKYLMQAKSIYDFPFDIRISKVTLRIRGTYITGKTFTKYIVFYLG